MPRVAPSVELMATARTWFSPMCCCTSATSLTGMGPRIVLHQQRGIDLRQVVGCEFDVEHRPDDLDDGADVLLSSD